MMTRSSLSAALVMSLAIIVAPSVRAQSDMPWCGDVDGAKNCIYPTLDDCERWMRPEGGLCLPNPRGDEIE